MKILYSFFQHLPQFAISYYYYHQLFQCFVLITADLIKLICENKLSCERRQQVDVIYLDFSKAFDRVSHEKLLFKLQCLGIGGSLLAWFRSYLSGRRHRVVIDNKSSDFPPCNIWSPARVNFGALTVLDFYQ